MEGGYAVLGSGWVFRFPVNLDRRGPAEPSPACAVSSRDVSHQNFESYKPEVQELVCAADRLGSLMQYETPGFLPNKRIHRGASEPPEQEALPARGRGPLSPGVPQKRLYRPRAKSPRDRGGNGQIPSPGSRGARAPRPGSRAVAVASLWAGGGVRARCSGGVSAGRRQLRPGVLRQSSFRCSRGDSHVLAPLSCQH